MLRKIASGLIATLFCATATQAGVVVVLGNTETGEVIIRGNFPNGQEGEDAVHQAKAQRETGWTQLFGNDEPGWGAVACVSHDGQVYFSQVNGQKSEAEAIDGAKWGAERFIKENGGGTLIPLCAPRWNNHGQVIVFGGDGVSVSKDDKSTDVMDLVKGTIRKAVTGDYHKDCVRPEPPATAEAKLRPIGTGTAPLDATQPKKASTSSEWKPASWCPKNKSGAVGKRG